MRRILMLSLLAAAACGPTRARVVVTWTFGGLSCADAGVATIQFDIAGEVLSPNQFTCAQASGGADLGTYLLGRYELTVSGFDASGTLTHQVTQTLDVRRGGENDFNIDVPQVAATTGDVTLNWTFGGKSCAAAGITVVHASVDSQVLTDGNGNPDLPCSVGGTDGTTVSPLSAGRHTFDLVGVDSGGNAKYALNGYMVTVVAGQNAIYNPDLAPATPTTASANMTWTFDGKNCTTAGVDRVRIFMDPDSTGAGGTEVLGSKPIACNNLGTDGISIDGIPPGSHSFAIYGIRSSDMHLLYRTHNPKSSFFAIGLITDVLVSAESPP